MFNEAEVVAEAVKGNIKAFEHIVQQYEKLVFSVLNKLLPITEDVEEVSQDVFMKVYKNLTSFQFQSKLSTWIARIAYLTALNHIKRNTKMYSGSGINELDNWYFTHDTPEKTYETKDSINYITRLMDQMPLQYKTVITLYHIHEFSYQEIAQITGLPEGTVKGYLFRARKLLKDKLTIFYSNQ